MAPIMFLAYVNDMIQGVSSYISLFADDAKLLRQIRNHKDCKELHSSDINKIYESSKDIRIGIYCQKKSHVLEMGKSAMRHTWTYNLGQNIISIAKEKVLVVVIQDNLSPEKHIDRIFDDTFRRLRNTDGFSLPK